MDVRMPGMDGLEATKQITQKLPDIPVLIFTAYSERSLLSRGLDSGAKGYILKEAPHQTLVRAIEKVSSGEVYVDPALMPAFLPGKGDDMLTAREREILQLLADGMSNADVAAKLFISQETVKSHVRHILTKLEAWPSQAWPRRSSSPARSASSSCRASAAAARRRSPRPRSGRSSGHGCPTSSSLRSRRSGGGLRCSSTTVRSSRWRGSRRC